MNGAEGIIKLDSVEIEIQHKDETKEQRLKEYHDFINQKKYSENGETKKA